MIIQSKIPVTAVRKPKRQQRKRVLSFRICANTSVRKFSVVITFILNPIDPSASMLVLSNSAVYKHRALQTKMMASTIKCNIPLLQRNVYFTDLAI